MLRLPCQRAHVGRAWRGIAGLRAAAAKAPAAWRRSRTSSASARAAAATQQTAAPPPPQLPVHFSELPLDRAAVLRSQPAELQRLLDSPDALVLPLHRGRALAGPVLAASAAASLALKLESGAELPLAAHSFAPAGAATAEGVPPKWLPLVLAPAGSGADPWSELRTSMNASMGFTFLGLALPDGRAVFAYELAQPASVVPAGDVSGSGAAQPAAAAAAAAAEACQWAEVRSAGQGMAGPDAAVLALATGLARWHASAAFCARTGAPTAATSGGHARVAQLPNDTPAAAAAGSRGPPVSYPRIDPAVIVAATCGDWLLLGRKASWDKGRYSLLAGFCELGETLEQAAVREVAEESGVQVDPASLTYHSSQPWPFPRSLMIGFTGAARASAAAAAGPPFHLLSAEGQAAAHDVGMTQQELSEHLLPVLPPVQVDTEELEDARWFHRSYLMALLSPSLTLPPSPAGTSRAAGNGSTSGGGSSSAAAWPGQPDPRYWPRLEAEEFRIPGRYALANRIVSSWLLQQAQHGLNGDGSGGSAWLGDRLPSVSIDEGTFKYVLLRLSAPAPPGEALSSNGSSGGNGGSSGGNGAAPGWRSKLLVRGDARAGYHDNIYKAALREVKAALAAVASAPEQPAPAAVGSSEPQQPGPQSFQQQQAQQVQQAPLKLEVLGGGRIEHYPAQRLASIYGYSSAFGAAPHEVTAALLKCWLPFHEVTISYEGY